MLVLKFGGTSVGSPEAIRKLIDIVKGKDHGDRVRVVVVSAFSKVTDTLIDIARRSEAGDRTYTETLKALVDRHLMVAKTLLPPTVQGEAEEAINNCVADLERALNGIAELRELSDRSLDYIMSFGERLSASLIAKIFTANGVPADYVDARPLIKTDGVYGNARFIPEETYPAIRAYLEGHPNLQIVTGFIGSNADNRTTTLGRGGSDLSAAIFGAAMTRRRWKFGPMWMGSLRRTRSSSKTPFSSTLFPTWKPWSYPILGPRSSILPRLGLLWKRVSPFGLETPLIPLARVP